AGCCARLPLNSAWQNTAALRAFYTILRRSNIRESLRRRGNLPGARIRTAPPRARLQRPASAPAGPLAIWSSEYSDLHKYSDTVSVGHKNGSISGAGELKRRVIRIRQNEQQHPPRACAVPDHRLVWSARRPVAHSAATSPLG